jgi:hypothetical protein
MAATRSTGNAWAGGLTTFAGLILLMGGVLALLQGISALAKDEVYVRTRDYTYSFDLTTWGWIHLLLGVAAIAVGLAIMAGQTWGLLTGIAVAVLSAIANFLFLPQYPLWALVLITLDVAVIWALSRMLHPTPR